MRFDFQRACALPNRSVTLPNVLIPRRASPFSTIADGSEGIFMSANHSERHQRKAGTHDRTEKRKSSTGPIRSANTLRRAHVLILVLPDVRNGMCFIGRRLGLPSAYFLCIIEYALGNREAQWRVLKAKTNEMQSSTPRPAYLRSAVLPLPQPQRYQNKLASPRELCLRTSRLRMI
jgi:hypothetical protein